MPLLYHGDDENGYVLKPLFSNVWDYSTMFFAQQAEITEVRITTLFEVRRPRRLSELDFALVHPFPRIACHPVGASGFHAVLRIVLLHVDYTASEYILFVTLDPVKALRF
jgi:hypothetical protein